MFIIEYVQGNRLHTIVCKDETEAGFTEAWLVSLNSVSLVIVWGAM